MSRLVRSPATDYHWYSGDLRFLLRPHGQKRAYEFIQSQKVEADLVDPLVLNCHRRFGKSFLMLLLGIMRCISQPHQQVKYAAATYEQVRDIVMPLWDQILETCPDELRPKQRGFEFTWRNPRWDSSGYSVFKLVGANFKKGDLARGMACDLALLDEVRDYNQLRYFWESILVHQFVGRDEPCCIMATTPPNSIDHDFCRPPGLGDSDAGFVHQAMESSRYLVIPGSKNEDFSARDRKIVATAIHGGEDSVAWRREVECELISEEKKLICPEFVAFEAELVVDSWERPDWFFPYVAMDTGFDPDHTAILFGYIDFLKQKLVFEREVVRRRMNTREIADAIKGVEKELKYADNHHRVRRRADIDKRGLEDLRKDYGLYFKPVDKHDSDASLIKFRSGLMEERMVFLRDGVPMLIYQLANGVWNDTGSDFLRTETMGHWDAGKAAVYLYRSVHFKENPIDDPIFLRDREFRLEPKRSKVHNLLKALGRL